MKKIKSLFALLFIFFSAFLLVGCRNNQVEEIKEYTVRYETEEGTLIQEFVISEGKDISLLELTKEGYTFDGWYCNGKKIEKLENLSSDTTLVAVFSVKEYTYKFVVNGEVIKEVTAPYGSTIEYVDAPTLGDDAKSEYVFVGWDNSVKTLTKDEVFNALIYETDKVYTYTFYDDLGNVVKKAVGTYGEEIEYPSDLTKEKDPQYSYTFVGWDKNDTTLTNNIEFRPIFEKTINKYTYSFVLDDGTILKEGKSNYGSVPVAPSNVTKEDENGKTFVFVGWDKEITELTEDVVYTAVFESKEFTLEGLRLSIFGDSISTFYSPSSPVNSYYTGDYQYYYPDRCPSINTVEKTWWYQLYNNNGMVLGVNNSWSGSCAYGQASDYSTGQHKDRLNTVDKNGKPDLVIIYMGTNDLSKGYTVEEYSSAIQTMIKSIRSKGINDILLFTLGYTNFSSYKYTETGRVSYNEELRRLAKEYECGIIPLDEYIVEDNYMLYLSDQLHYSAKGAELISLIAEKAVKEYYGLTFDKEIVVEHKELVPEGYTGKIVATTGSDYFNKYTTDVFFGEASTITNPLYTDRYQIKKNDDGTYYVSAISKSGTSLAYDCDYVLFVSPSHVNYQNLKYDLSKVQVGSIVEFKFNGSYPVEILFKDPVA